MSKRPLALLLFLAATSASAAEPLTVRGAVERALARDPSLKAAERAADEAAASVKMARSAFRPQFALTTTPGATTGLPLSVAGELPAAAGARLRLTLWDPGQKIDEADAAGRAARLLANAAGARQETIHRTVSAFARAWAGQRRVETAGRRLAAREAIDARTQARRREGRATDLDASRTALGVDRARQLLRTARSERDLAAGELRRLADLPDGDDLPLAQDPLGVIPEPASGDAVPAALAADPALRSLADEAGFASRAATLSGRWFQPQVVAEARYLYVPPYYNYDKYYLKVETNTGSAGVSVVIPILSGGLDAARAAGTRAHEERLREQRRAREDEVVREAQGAASRAERTAGELGLAKKSVAVASEALRVAQALDREGRGESDGVPRAELDAADAEDERWRAEEALALARLDLLALRGELSALAPAAPGR